MGRRRASFAASLQHFGVPAASGPYLPPYDWVFAASSVAVIRQYKIVSLPGAESSASLKLVAEGSSLQSSKCGWTPTNASSGAPDPPRSEVRPRLHSFLGPRTAPRRMSGLVSDVSEWNMKLALAAHRRPRRVEARQRRQPAHHVRVGPPPAADRSAPYPCPWAPAPPAGAGRAGGARRAQVPGKCRRNMLPPLDAAARQQQEAPLV